MSAIVVCSCCCGTCQPKRDFRVTLRSQAARELFQKTTLTTTSCPGDPPSCNPISTPCTCPSLGQCLATFAPGTNNCDVPGIEQHYISNFDMGSLVVTVPYVTTSTETPLSSTGCTWRVNIGGTLQFSGLGYTGLRDRDENSVVVNYSRTFTTCAGCCSWSASGSSESQRLIVNYGHRCTYGIPPSYMTVQRASSGTYLNWTWEITSGVFIVRNASGTIQSSCTLAGKTLAQALTVIDAFPSVVAVGPSGSVPADSMPATLMYDRTAVLLKVSPLLDQVYLVPPGTTVEDYQDGVMSAYWEIGSDNTSLGTLCLNRFYLKNGCDSSDPHDYTGGTTLDAERVFCKGIATKFYDWPNTYDPITGFGDVCQGWTTASLSINTFGSAVANYPTGHWETTDCTYVWVQDAPCGDIDPQYNWFLSLGAYGDTPTDLSFGGQDMCSDSSVANPTYCYSTANLYGCDYCSNGCGVGQGCLQTQHREGWRVKKSFKVERL